MSPRWRGRVCPAVHTRCTDQPATHGLSSAGAAARNRRAAYPLPAATDSAAEQAINRAHRLETEASTPAADSRQRSADDLIDGVRARNPCKSHSRAGRPPIVFKPGQTPRSTDSPTINIETRKQPETNGETACSYRYRAEYQTDQPDASAATSSRGPRLVAVYCILGPNPDSGPALTSRPVSAAIVVPSE